MPEASAEQLHWNQLRKQFLLDEEASDYYHVAKTQLGLHSTDYWTPYLSVWARIGDYDARKMFEDIDNGRQLVRTHSFRTTVHVMHTDNLSLILSATGPPLFRAFRNDKYRKMDLKSDKEIEEMLEQVRSALEDGPLRTSELKKAVPKVGENVRSALILLMAQGEVVRAKAKHARSNLTSYALLEKWTPKFKLEIIEEEKAVSELVKKHIELFGPVSVEDTAWWFKQAKTAVKEAIQGQEEDVVMLEIDGTEKYLSLADLEIASSIDPPSDSPVWFLPYEDHFLKAFIDRSRFISEKISPMISPPDRRHYWPSKLDEPRVMPSPGVRQTGEVRPTIWLNGVVVGRWEIDDEGGQKRIVTDLYSKVTKRYLERIEEVRRNLEDFMNNSLLPISGGN
ncbi:MAG: winged helix DNA-binding domain-containing protein [Candidatus Thorarchaeota archaeon]